MQITLDSNVWRIIASPSVFPNEPALDDFKSIRGALIDGRAAAFLAETVFTLEATRRADRREFFANYPKHNVTLNPILEQHLNDARAIGIRLLRCPRPSVPISVRHEIPGN